MADENLGPFNWYQTLIDLGKFEVQHARARFYETAKLHLAIAAAILALDSYGIANNQSIILFLAALVSFFGVVNAMSWKKQIKSASIWESRWYVSAAQIEETEEFRKIVKANEVKVWSHEEVKSRINPSAKKVGASPKMYETFVVSITVFYILLAVGSIGFGYGAIKTKQQLQAPQTNSMEVLGEIAE